MHIDSYDRKAFAGLGSFIVDADLLYVLKLACLPRHASSFMSLATVYCLACLESGHGDTSSDPRVRVHPPAVPQEATAVGQFPQRRDKYILYGCIRAWTISLHFSEVVMIDNAGLEAAHWSTTAFPFCIENIPLLQTG